MTDRLATARRAGLRPSPGAERPALGAVAKPGFTLVEVVAATALSAVLLTAVLAVIRTVHRPTRAIADPMVALSLAEQVRWDVANAVVARADARGLTLAGYGSLDPATLAPTHEPTTVTYTLRPAGGRQWLVREQSLLDGRVEGGTWDELIAGDVAGLSADVPAMPTTRPEDDPTPLSFAQLAGLRPVPPRVGVRVRFADGSTVDVGAVR